MENAEAGRPDTAESIDLKKLRRDHYPNIALTRFLNVDYVHAKTGDGGDIYVTRHGLPFIRPHGAGKLVYRQVVQGKPGKAGRHKHRL